MAQKQKSQNKQDSFIPAEYLSIDFFQEDAVALPHTKSAAKQTESALDPEHERAITESLDRVLRRFKGAHTAPNELSRATKKAATVIRTRDKAS